MDKDITKCNDWGDPGKPYCVGIPDARYTMRFDEIGQPPILWGASCGPEAMAVDAALQEKLVDPVFADEFGKAVLELVGERQGEN